MKVSYLACVAVLFLVSSCGTATQPTKEVVETETEENKTIETASGLKYTYITKGTGKKVEMGSEVRAYLSLVVNDSVVWNTDEMPDSQFVFEAGARNLIEGFNEMALLLREGDEVTAYMPAEIAYGIGGTPGFVPPSTPITYAPFRVLKVSDPVKEATDSLGQSKQ